MYIDREFTVKIEGKLDRYDISELEYYLQEYMVDENIKITILKEEVK